MLENADQNLIAPSTIDQIWSRHLLDSLQLLPLAPASGSWLDLGSGGGFPGLVIALVRPEPITLVEPRRLRAEFLARAADRLGVSDRMTVLCARGETVRLPPQAVISARAVGPLDRLFATAAHLADPQTVWLLPKGRSATAEVAAVERAWHGRLRLVPSITSADSAIVVADHVRRRGRAS